MTPTIDLPLTAEQRLRLNALDSVYTGQLHSGGDQTLESFGYIGLGFCPHHTEREQIIARAAKDVLELTHPDDIRVVKTPDGRRLLVRAVDERNQPTTAFRVMRKFADLAGV